MTTGPNIADASRPLHPDQFMRVRELLLQGNSIAAVAKTMNLTRQTVYRIQQEPQKQLAAVRAWYPEAEVDHVFR